jgi:hypothetical protein
MQPGYANVQPSKPGGAAAASAQATLPPTGREGQDADQQMQIEQPAREAGDVTARRVSQAALWSFAVLILSGVVAGYGGRGGRKTTVVDEDVRHPQPKGA